VDWVNLYRQKGISGLKLVNKRKVLMSKKEKEIKNILKSKDNKPSYTKEEIEYILAENEYLKKLHALVQEKNQKNQK
jgi:transposase